MVEAIPFHFARPGVPLILVPARINDDGPFDLILDTGNGSESLLLAPEVAASLGIETHEKIVESKFPIGLSKVFHVGRADSLQLGKLRTGPLEIAASPAIAQLAQRLRTRIDGNVGYGFLKDFVVSLDCSASTLTLTHEEPAGTPIPFEVGRDEPLIVVEVAANDTPLRFVLDTGASYCCISTTAAAQLKLSRGAEYSVNGAPDEKSYLTKLDTLRVGDREQVGVGIVVADFLHDLSEALGARVDGILGHSFWSRYVLTIDYPRQRLFLEDAR